METDILKIGKGVEKPFINASRGMQNSNDGTGSTLFEDVYTKKNNTNTNLFESWGYDNKLPYRIMKWVIDSPLLLPLLTFKVDTLIGEGITTYKVEGYDKDGKPIKIPIQNPEIDDWLSNNNIEEILPKIATDYYFLGNYFTEFISTKKNSQIALVNHIDATTIRPKRDKFGFIINPDFNNYQQVNDTEITKFIQSNISIKSVYQGLKYFPSNSFYGVPSWLGASQFIEYLNKIPNFKKSLIGNITAPSWLVTFPQEYFNVLFPDDSPEEQAKKYEDVCEQIANFLQGSENAGKPLITRTIRTSNGQETAITITPLENKTPDTLFNSDFEQMFQILCSSTQVPPSLASMLVPGKLSSGSDILNSWNAYNARIEPDRQIILQFLKKIKIANNWDKKIQFGFLNKELKTLNTNPKGQKTTL